MIKRRNFIKYLAANSALAAIVSRSGLASLQAVTRKAIPSTGELLPVIGMGSWQTFDVRDDDRALATRLRIMQTFFDMGGILIDSSPMYGASESVIGHCLEKLAYKPALFSATKVWKQGRGEGIRQMTSSRRKWGVDMFDLMQIHNMLDWENHIETLKDWKAGNRIRYIGITTSHGRRHEPLQEALRREPFDFVQFTYNILDREAEQRLLPLAADRGLAVIINRPFRGGGLFSVVRGKPLPAWAGEIDCENWAQFFLKFIVSHPAVTCAIPATSQLRHMQENMAAGFGRLPDAITRQRMIRYMENV